MAVLTPGVYMQWQGNNDRIGHFSGGASLNVNGLDSGQNNFILDGVSNNLELTGIECCTADRCDPRSVGSEQRLLAEFGRAGRSVVNIAMKSGTNQIHGFGYDYIQNDKFNARPYDFTGTNPAKQPLRQNLFGGGVSGPPTSN
jgi:hypothetical protein